MTSVNLWGIYGGTKEDSLQGDLVIRYLPLVRLHASRLALGLPHHVCRDDLIQSGVLGLMEALRRFDPSRGVKFETYAAQRIRGAMLDELRRLSWIPRTLFREMRDMDRAAQTAATRLGREPEVAELAAEMGTSVEKLQKIQSDINCVSVVSLEDALFAAPSVDGPEIDVLGRMMAEEEKVNLAAAIEALPNRHKQLLALYYQEGLTLKEVGLVLGVTESRVCQLHARIITRLRSFLSQT